MQEEAARQQLSDPAHTKVSNLLQRMSQNVCAAACLKEYQDASSLGTINVVLNHYFLAFNGYEVRHLRSNP